MPTKYILLTSQSKYPVLHLGEFGKRDFYFWEYLLSRPNTEKKNWTDYEQLLRTVFSCVHGPKIVAFVLKSCIISLFCIQEKNLFQNRLMIKSVM